VSAPPDALRDLCSDAALRLLDPALRQQVTAVRDRLDAPLQVAVAGAVSGGKSTLVNALLAQPVAPADAGECTRVVTWYEYGPEHGRVEVELDSGATRTRRLDPGGRMPSTLDGIDMDDVVRIRVQLDLPALRALTVIDTPGVNTVATRNEQAARRMLFGTDGDDHAQALIYVLRYLQRFDADTLADFRTLSAACGMTGVNTLAVLSQIDRRGDVADPWPTARRLADTAYDHLRLSAFDVVPVIGLLAETARAEPLDAADVDALRELAALDPLDLDDLLLDLAEFAASPAFPVPAATRARLLGRLHRYGLVVATTLLRERPETDTAALNQALLQHSGFSTGSGQHGSVAAGIAHFGRRAEQLKALAAITQLRQVARSSAGVADRAVLDTLAAALDDGSADAGGLAGLRVLAAVEAVGRGQLTLDEEMLTDLLRLARHDDPAEQLGLAPGASRAEIAEAARQASVRWRSRALSVGTHSAGLRARDVLGVLESLAAPQAEKAGRPAGRPDVNAPPVPLERALLKPLLSSPVLTDAQRASLRALVDGSTVAEQVGALPEFTPTQVAAKAAAAGAQFRALLHRPLPGLDKRAVTAVCGHFEAIFALMSTR
jgi:hypothetical protein